MTVLSVIQQHCRMHALSIPTAVVSATTDTTVQQLYGILQSVIDELIEESKYNVTTREATFTTVASESQGSIATLAPYGIRSIVPGTFYDRTLKRPLYGPLTEIEWQQIKALPNPGPFYKFRIRGGQLLINPVPAAPFSTIAFEYMSSWAIVSSASALKAAITADDDFFVFPENIIQRGLSFRWKQIKGLPYQADETRFYELLTNHIAKDKAKPMINVAEPHDGMIKPGVFVPSGNWMQ